MKQQRNRRWRPGVHALEGRVLLAATASLPAVTATWLGQDGHDLVGPSSIPGPDGVQDIHIGLANLPANLPIVQADVQGQGGGEWAYPPGGAWAAAVVQAPGSTTADLYIEPYQVETGRSFSVALTFSDQSTASVLFQGGTADPNLRVPDQALAAQWLGQDGHDWTGPTAAVGPDGFQDSHIALAHLSAGVAITSASVDIPGGAAWVYGTNPDAFPDAEIIPDPSDPTRADLYFSPQTNLDGQTLNLAITYANGTSDRTTVAAGPTDPTLRMSAPAAVTVVESALTVTWLGQDGQNLTGPGDVHLALAGLPAGHTVVAAQLTDGTLTSWDYTTAGASLQDGNAGPLPLAFRPDPSDPSQADLGFPPIRDESQAAMTLRLVLDDGSNQVVTFPGGAANVALRAPGPSATSIVAAPGDDLAALANQYGTVHLTAGTYNLSAPLVLNQSVTITADPGATLVFAQAAGGAPWTAAIKIKAGNTTLSGFAVRFSGPINWASTVNYGAAVIGTTDNLDSGPSQLLVNITLSGLDLETPPAASAWEAAPDLIRAVSAQSGAITNNTLKGGTTEFFGGPWQIVGNTYQGTVPGTYTGAAFAGHWTHDVVVANNQAQLVGPSGKTYRFLVLTQSGIDDAVKNNNVVGIGPMDSDTEPNPNATEVVLTESYDILYEGAPLAISPDGRIVQITGTLQGSIQGGETVAILAGPEAGQWRQVAQEINPTTFLLDTPLDPGTTAISITTGFVNLSVVGNTIDTRGSSTAQDLVLPGNQFGLHVRNNTLIGGAVGFLIAAYPSESPSLWGWTHMPVLGATISGNTVEDTFEGGVLDVDHGANTKSNVGRVYLSALLTNNTGVWTGDFVSQLASNAQLRVLTVGMAPSHDPAELLVALAGNQVEGPTGVVSGATEFTAAATVNGQEVTGQGTVLPTVALAAPTGLALVDDTGSSGVDGQTSDPHLRFDPVALAAGYEYSLTGAAGSYLPVTTPASFLPQGLAPGFNAVFVRAYDAVGDRGPDALIEFAYVPGSGSGSAGSSPTPVASRTVAYLYGVSGGGALVPLGQSIILTAAEELGAPLSITIQSVGAGPGDPTVGNPAPGTVTIADQGSPAPESGQGSSDAPGPSSTASTPAPAPGAGATSAASAAPAGDQPAAGAVAPSPSPTPPDPAVRSGPAQATPQIVAMSESGAFVLTKPVGAYIRSRPGGAKLTHGPGWSRPPDPFRRGGNGAHPIGHHSRKHVNR
jgi:hypothetical protein